MKLNAQPRTILGKKVSRLREQNLIPAVIFSKGIKSIPINVNKTDFEKIYKKAGETSIIEILLDSQKFSVLISQVQHHPVSSKILHANFHKVDLSEKITASVPIVLVGESPIVKSGEGMVLTLVDSLEIEALPNDLPKEIAIDISNLKNIDDAVKIADLKINQSKLTIKDKDDDDLVIKIGRAQMAEEAEEEVKEEAVIEEKKEAAEEREAEESKEIKEEKSKDAQKEQTSGK